MTDDSFPERDWTEATPADAGLDASKLESARKTLETLLPDKPYRVAIVRNGLLVAEWLREWDGAQKVHIASAMKSVLSNLLGIAVAEGKIESADIAAVDVFPEMMDVPPDRGPKEGRYAFEANRGATLRQLICNVSGYLKPGEDPGRIFHYQTTGMCLLTHCIETAYGVYDVNDPEGSPKIGVLFKEKIADRIGADREYHSGSQKMQEKARMEVFGWGTSIRTSLRDHARMGWLWCNFGKWGDDQVIPEEWMRQSVVVNPFIRENCPEEEWRYGHGFWTNEFGSLWPDLPRDAFSSWGAGGNYAVCFPTQGLVVAMNPINFDGQTQPYETMKEAWLLQQQVLEPILSSLG